MDLKEIVDDLLREENRSLSWLATEMGRTFEGLKLSLVKGSIKYTDLKLMALALKVSPGRFFGDAAIVTENNNLLQEEVAYYATLRNDLNSCKELVTALKGQVKDKDKIIQLLSENTK